MTDKTPLKDTQAGRARAQPDKDRLPLNEAQIYNWLTDNPDFLIRNEALLAVLSLPEQASGAISLHQRQLQVLRNNNAELEGKLLQIVENAKSAQSINQRLFELATLLIQDRADDKPASFLNERIRSHFDLISVRLIGKLSQSGSGVSASFDLLNVWLGGIHSRCEAQCKEPWLAKVFGDVSLQVKSVAIVPVFVNDEVTAILALGAKDEQRFQAGMAVEALDQLGALVSPLV